MRTRIDTRGFSFVEVIIVSAIMVLVFGALFASFQYSLKLITLSRTKLSAMSVASDRMEYFRSLPYDSVGTVSGFPAGLIPQNSTTTLNGIEITERVRVTYVDDPADGVGASDSNSITTDYKQIRLRYTWSVGDLAGEIVLVSNIVPRSIETNVGGGTARVNVIDHASALLPGAQVRLFNTGLGYDVSANTDTEGAALFSVPAGNEYQVEVSGPIGGFDYSVDRTYFATTSNPNPVVVPFTVLEGDVSTLTFQIGRLSNLTIKVLSAVAESSYADDFTDLTGVASSSAVEVVGGSLVLTNTAGVYSAYGEAYIGPITPSPLEAWQAITVASEIPNDASYRVHVLTGSGPYTLVPEADLPGNTAGFSGTTISIADLDPSLYPAITLGLILETADTSVTPEIEHVEVFYREAETPLVGETINVRGEKIIGTTASLEPIYKFSTTTVTDSAGEVVLSDIEFDLYSTTFSGSYDITLGCPAYPYALSAGTDGTVELVLDANETNSLRLTVLDLAGQPVPGATATLTRSGYNETRRTGACGQIFYPGDSTPQVDYTLTVSAEGYQPLTVSDVAVNGDAQMSITLMP